MGADVRAPTRVCPNNPRLDSSTQARESGVATVLAVHWLVSLAVLSSVPGGVQAAKPRPQHALPFFPYRWGLPPARYGHAMATAADGSVWIFGGEESNFEKYSNELLKLDLQERRWHNVTTAGPQPSGRRDHTMTAVANGTRLLVFGGSSVPRVHGQSKCDDSWIFNVLSAEWTQLTAGATGVWPNERIGHAMAAVSDTSVLLFGGQTGADYAGYALDELWSLDVPRNSWTQLTTGEPGVRPTLTARYGHTMATVSATRVILFGGKRMSDFSPSDELFSLEFLDTASHTVRCTRLNDETVTAEELSGQFNSLQVTRRICTMSA